MLQHGPGAIKDLKGGNKDSLPAAHSTPDQTAAAVSEDDESDVFDLLIIGGGATGAGCAVDAATRGLKVAMVERDDFSSGKLCFSFYSFSFFCLCGSLMRVQWPDQVFANQGWGQTG